MISVSVLGKILIAHGPAAVPAGFGQDTLSHPIFSRICIHVAALRHLRDA
jgi:hypothetical protein